MNHQDKYEVIIVGGGPVGVGLAIELGLKGISVAVVEKYHDPQPIPKGQNLTQRTLEHFYAWGIEDELRAARTMPQGYPIGGMTCYDTLLSDYSFPWLKRELVRPFYFTDNERLPQYETERVLREKMATLPTVDAFWGFPVETVTQTDQSAEVIARERNGDGVLKLTADYVVGCDGSRSVVRTEAGINQTLSDHDKKMVLLVFRSPQLNEKVEAKYPGKSFFKALHPGLKGYWRFFGKVTPGSWFFHCPVPHDTTVDHDHFAKLVCEAAGADVEIEFEHIGFWDLRFALADTYRNGRIFIAGDACHSHPPYGGYGINTGFEDARNLGWKLAAVLRGWGSNALLDSYSLERQPIFDTLSAEFIAASIQHDGAFLDRYNPSTDKAAFEQAWENEQRLASQDVDIYEPNYEGSPIVDGPPDGVCSARGQHQQRARAGHHLTPVTLSTGKNVYEAVGAGFTLIALDPPDGAIDQFAQAAAALNIPLEIISDSFENERTQYEARLILVRPDQFVAWAGDEIADAQACLKQAVGK